MDTLEISEPPTPIGRNYLTVVLDNEASGIAVLKVREIMTPEDYAGTAKAQLTLEV